MSQAGLDSGSSEIVGRPFPAKPFPLILFNPFAANCPYPHGPAGSASTGFLFLGTGFAALAVFGNWTGIGKGKGTGGGRTHKANSSSMFCLILPRTESG